MKNTKILEQRFDEDWTQVAVNLETRRMQHYIRNSIYLIRESKKEIIKIDMDYKLIDILKEKNGYTFCPG